MTIGRQFVVGALVLSSSISWGAPKPKYGPEATPLSISHDYARHNPAPDFWALMPYYVGQQDDRSCSLASVTMVVNAARFGRRGGAGSATADDELALQKTLLAKVKDDKWTDFLSAPMPTRVLGLDDLGRYLDESLKAYGLEGYTVEVIHTDDMEKATAARLHKALVENEKSTSDFIIINFIQGVLTGDADVGHIAPLGAYDAKTKRALVLDPDRQWYEPYWVSEAALLKSMVTLDKTTNKFRGFVWLKLKAD